MPLRTIRRYALALALLPAAPLATPLAAPLLAQPADTTEVKTTPLFEKRDLWIATGFVVATAAMFPFDKYAANELQDSSVQANRFFRHQATNVRLVTESAWYIGGGLYLAGKLSGNREMADLGLHGSEAVALGLGTVMAAKMVFGRRRPFVDVDDPTSFQFMRGLEEAEARSFPSGHTASAFAAAAAVSAETARFWPRTKWIIGPAMYGGATLVGLSRMFNNKHWASDVTTGALIGTFAGLKVVRYHHSHPNNRIDRWLLGAELAVPEDGGIGLAYRIPLEFAPR